MMSSSAKPMVLIVHGANCQPTHYLALQKALQDAGYEFDVPTLPTGSGERPASATFEQDVQFVRSKVIALTDTGRDIIILMHSYGGVVASSAIRGLGMKERMSEGKQGGVAHLVYLSAYMLREGRCIMDIVRAAGFGELLPKVIDFRDDGTCVPFDPAAGVFAELPGDVQKEQIELIVPFVSAGFDGKATYAAWKDMPSTYIYSEKDMWVPTVYQDMFLKQAEEDGVKVSVERFQVGHAMHASHPEKLVKTVQNINN